MIREDIEKWYRHEVLNNKTEYPNLYNLEVKRNNYRLFGTIFPKYNLKVKL